MVLSREKPPLRNGTLQNQHDARQGLSSQICGNLRNMIPALENPTNGRPVMQRIGSRCATASESRFLDSMIPSSPMVRAVMGPCKLPSHGKWRDDIFRPTRISVSSAACPAVVCPRQRREMRSSCCVSIGGRIPMTAEPLMVGVRKKGPVSGIFPPDSVHRQVFQRFCEPLHATRPPCEIFVG